MSGSFYRQSRSVVAAHRVRNNYRVTARVGHWDTQGIGRVHTFTGLIEPIE
jgi:hypothetical protein